MQTFLGRRNAFVSGATHTDLLLGRGRVSREHGPQPLLGRGYGL